MVLLWIFSLAASFPLLAMGAVVMNFSPCSQFFLDGKPPTLKPMNPARICQRYKNQYRFATMYERNFRIPIFSAYKYQPDGGKRRNNWKIEPQLALPHDQQRKNMELEKTCKIDPELLKSSQAVTEDYRNSTIYDRGHLLPVSHQSGQESKDATFTLTNIVPQLRELSQGKWKEYEKNMTNYTENCQNTYVIVGVVPGNKTLNNRVNIPSHIWAAACCVLQNKRESWAVIAQNDENKVVNSTLKELQEQLDKLYEEKLDKLYEEKVDLFNNAC